MPTGTHVATGTRDPTRPFRSTIPVALYKRARPADHRLHPGNASGGVHVNGDLSEDSDH